MNFSRASWFLLALSALCALTYGTFARDWVLHDAPLWARVALKTSGVALLAALAFHADGARLLVLALVFGALGDALLALESNVMFLLGAAAFVIGHVLYTVLFVRNGIGLRESLKAPRRLAMFAPLFVAAIVCMVWLWPRDSAAAPGTLIYTLALTGMTAASFTLPWRAALAMLGAVLFFVSDVILTWQMNHTAPDPLLARLINDASWFTYYFGQAGLCLGALRIAPRA